MGSLLNARVWTGQRIITAPYLAFLAHHHLLRLSFPTTALSPIPRSSEEEREKEVLNISVIFLRLFLMIKILLAVSSKSPVDPQTEITMASLVHFGQRHDYSYGRKQKRIFEMIFLNARGHQRETNQ